MEGKARLVNSFFLKIYNTLPGYFYGVCLVLPCLLLPVPPELPVPARLALRACLNDYPGMVHGAPHAHYHSLPFTARSFLKLKFFTYADFSLEIQARIQQACQYGGGGSQAQWS
jgi:hypothetical protein